MIERIKTALGEFAARHPEVLGVFIFGSYAKGRMRKSSDVDVAVYAEPEVVAGDLGLDVRLRYTVELEGMIGKSVDVVILNQAPPILRHQIFRDGVLVYERERSRVRRFIGDALVEFYDEIVPLEAAQKTLIGRRLLGR